MAHMIRRRKTLEKIKNVRGETSHIIDPKIQSNDKAIVWRVIAPFVTVPKRSKIEVEDEPFSSYLRKRPALLIRDLASLMFDSDDLLALFYETPQVLRNVTKSSSVALYIVDLETNEIYLSPGDVIADRYKVKWKIQENSTVAAHVAYRKEYVEVDDILLDKRFPDGIGYEGHLIPKSVLALPIVTLSDDCFAVIELVKSVQKPPFTPEDLKICAMVAGWMGVAIHQNKERFALKRQRELNDCLLELVKCYFEEHVLMEKLMSEVVKFAKLTLGAERGSFFILDPEGDEMVAHLFDEHGATDSKTSKKVRIAKERGIAGLVARTGVTVNIKDAYQDSRFNQDIDAKTGFITRSILCMPILGAHGVLGVVQVVNKKKGGYFTRNDEDIFKMFSLYCSLAVYYTNIHDHTHKQKHLNQILLKLVQLQQRPCIHDYTKFLTTPLVKIPSNFDSFSWYISNNDELELLPPYSLHMIFQLISISEIDVSTMIKFILTVRKFYRDIPYHNFEHAFNVCHCMYVTLKRNYEKFSKLEVKALLIACLCHDLDHVGFTNSFLHITKHDLALLYGSSILENHHWNTTQMLLNDHEIFVDMNKETRKRFHGEIQKAILATDLAIYFHNRIQLIKLLNVKEFSWVDRSHRDLVKAILINTCDVSGQCKPFLAAKRVTDNLYREFYRQGDLEKEMGQCPLSVMDRDKQASIPNDQICFLNVIVIPCAELLRTLLPNIKEIHLGAILLRDSWENILNARGQKIWRQDDSIVDAKCQTK